MDLVTVINSKFFPYALKHLRCFRDVYPKNKIVVCVFGDLGHAVFRFSKNLEVVEIPEDVEHAWNPRFYYFKTAALKIGMEQCRELFLYMDACHRIISRPVEIESALHKHGRFYVEFPRIDYFKMKYWATMECIKRLGATYESIEDCYQYQAGLQAYVVNEENKKFVDEMLNYMRDPLIAGPSNWLQQPDGPNAICKAHRNDLSVLSILIQRHGFDQPFSVAISEKYGDRMTLERFGGNEGHNWDNEPRIIPRQF
ncbi:MAG: hypothetical protein ABIH23_11575 [bacterium]